MDSVSHLGFLDKEPVERLAVKVAHVTDAPIVLPLGLIQLDPHPPSRGELGVLGLGVEGGG